MFSELRDSDNKSLEKVFINLGFAFIMPQSSCKLIDEICALSILGAFLAIHFYSANNSLKN